MKKSVRVPAPRPRRLERREPRRILIVNGVTVWREALSSRINRSSGLTVCGEAIGEKAAFEEVRRLRPHLVLTEIMRPQDLGFVRELHQLHPRLPILVFSFRDEEAYAPKALDAGARGYLAKGVDGGTLVAGIREVLNGRVVLSPRMAARLRRKVVWGRQTSRMELPPKLP
jgi:DNA-binding NarL/FixJ family response regulator